MTYELVLRITFIQPPHDVLFRARRGKTDLIPPTHASDDQLSFDFPVRVANTRADGAPNVLGPFTHGSPASRFLAVVSGTLAGQADSCWTRAAKVPLCDITWSLIQEAFVTPDVVVAARIAGTAKDGGPACATVPLLDEGWRIVPKSTTATHA